MSAYQKPNGIWYVLQKVDATTLVERPAFADEIPKAIEPEVKVIAPIVAPQDNKKKK